MTSGPENLTSSGDVVYNQVATQIITQALFHMGVINEDETPTAGMFAKGIIGLNLLVKDRETSGIHIWTEREAILFLQQAQTRYLLGGTTTDHCADAYSYTLSTLALSAAAGSTTVTLVTTPAVTNPAGIIVGDQFGVYLDSGANFWTTVKSIAGLTITLNAALPSSAGAGNFIYDYTTNIVRPLRVPACRRMVYAATAPGIILTPMGRQPGQMLSRQEYMDLPNPNALGIVNSAYYNPARNQGEFFVWTAPQQANNAVRFTWYRPIENFDTVDDLQDFPDEWGNSLGWLLAKEQMLGYSVPAQRQQIILARAAELLEAVQGWDREPQSIYFGRSYNPAGGRG